MGEKKSLIVLLDERNQIAEQLEDAVNPAELMERMEVAVQVKAAGIALYCEKLDAMIEAVDVTIRKLQARKKALQNRKESLKEYALSAMQMHGIKKIECPECTLTVQKNPHKVEIDDERMIPSEFWVYPPAPPPYVDKEKVKKAYLDDGEVVQGTRVVQTEGLRIR